jgi:transcriptional regulator of acetoin/glycerol metabolism
MPRVKPLTETARKDKAFLQQLYGAMKVEKTTVEKLAKILGISDKTLYRRMKRPDTFTLGEIRALREIFPGIEIQ